MRANEWNRDDAGLLDTEMLVPSMKPHDHSNRDSGSEVRPWRHFVRWRRQFMFVFVPLQTALILFLIRSSPAGGTLALLVGMLAGVFIVGVLLVRSRRLLDKVAPESRLFGSLASIWPTQLLEHSRLSPLVASPIAVQRSPQRAVDGVVWLDMSGVHWHPSARGRRSRVAPFELRREEIEGVSIRALGLRNVALDILTSGGHTVTFKAAGAERLMKAVRALGVPLQESSS